VDIVARADAGIALMDSKKKVTISWSGGKDSAFALYKILETGEFEVTGLHTIINVETRRVGMHGIREELMDEQAKAIGLPLTKLYLEGSENHVAYEKLMRDYYQLCADNGIHGVMFGDIFLEDLKQFRIALLKTSGLEAIFPLWRMNTTMLMEQFIQAGFKTIVCSANADLLTREQVGSVIDEKFLLTLNPSVDPCGENGEFHTFVFNGPLFKEPVPILKGEVVKKEYRYQRVNDQGVNENIESSFWFQDVLVRIAL
jgi:uncharacterized protein (TIGR00290 family)